MCINGGMDKKMWGIHLYISMYLCIYLFLFLFSCAWRIDAFELWCWRRFLRVSWTTRRSNQSILKEINLEYTLEGLVLKLNLQSFGHLMQRSQLVGKDPGAGKDWRQKEKGATEDEVVGWHHQLTGHEFEQALGDSEGQGSLVYCSPWGCKESDTI